MNTLTRYVLAQCLLLSAALAHAAADPGAAIADCRAKFADHPPEHIACLERALNASGGTREETAPPSIGDEQLKSKRPQETVDEATVEIANVTYGYDGMGLFRMSDGQVWKATESTPREQRLESGRTYSARIARGKMGGYRMYVEGASRMIRVTRTH
ncbi:hypothetical protein ACFPN2_22475 [Steroidobacter flavus]|uniref:Uncharacterized protein n=1 Tax=Steroidobacter flavus TaxID=1842136 RepID=A0ABV8SZG0_9GAMM